MVTGYAAAAIAVMAWPEGSLDESHGRPDHVRGPDRGLARLDTDRAAAPAATVPGLAGVKCAILIVALVVAAGCAQPPAPTSSEASLSPEPTAISEETAISIARAHPSPGLAPDDEVLLVRRGTFGELGSSYLAPGATPAAEPDRCVWFVNIGHTSAPQMGQGTVVIIDCVTGAVLQAYGWVT